MNWSDFLLPGLVEKKYGGAKGRLMQFNIQSVLGKQLGILIMSAVLMHHLIDSII